MFADSMILGRMVLLQKGAFCYSMASLQARSRQTAPAFSAVVEPQSLKNAPGLLAMIFFKLCSSPIVQNCVGTRKEYWCWWCPLIDVSKQSECVSSMPSLMSLPLPCSFRFSGPRTTAVACCTVCGVVWCGVAFCVVRASSQRDASV